VGRNHQFHHCSGTQGFEHSEQPTFGRKGLESSGGTLSIPKSYCGWQHAGRRRLREAACRVGGGTHWGEYAMESTTHGRLRRVVYASAREALSSLTLPGGGLSLPRRMQPAHFYTFCIPGPLTEPLRALVPQPIPHSSIRRWPNGPRSNLPSVSITSHTDCVAVRSEGLAQGIARFGSHART
jgi:hypothetical protein